MRAREQTRSHARVGRWFEFSMKLRLSSAYDLLDWPILRNFCLARIAIYLCGRHAAWERMWGRRA